jgi:hypothetical protein
MPEIEGDSASLLAAGPPVAAATQTGPSFIGVPDGYFYDSGVRTMPRGAAGGPRSADSIDRNPVRLPQYTSGSEVGLTFRSVEDVARWQAALAKVGLIGSNTRVTVGVADEATLAAYREVLAVANRYGITDEAALTRLLESPQTVGGKPVEEEQGDVARTTTSTSKQFAVTDRASARSILNRATSDLLGRAATGAEERAFFTALHAEEEDDPTVTTTTSTTDPDGNTDSTTRTDFSDVDPQEEAFDYAQADPGYGAYQAAATYFPLLMDAVSAVVPE